MEPFDLTRFEEAHRRDFATALAEIQAGKKRTHWIWYIFPQLRGLGRSIRRSPPFWKNSTVDSGIFAH